METNDKQDGIAIIGIACKFPGAANVNEFWDNLCAKRESITFFSREELEDAGVSRETLDDPHYVSAAPTIEGVRLFDAAFFGYTGSEATLMDPQQRLFHEVAWQAFEDAGYQPGSHLGRVGVMAGSGGVVTSYLSAHQARAPELLGPTGSLQHIGNDKDFVSTRISHKLDLTGPSINIQTACSTSLVAVHLACRSLLDGESDMMLVGASTVRCPHEAGYRYRSEDILSPDGHCRAFDESAQGTIFGSGVAAVLLKRLDAALADGDHVYAVIKGTAINNDGAAKMSYGASSVPGQSMAMVEALSFAGVDPDTLDYVECHATGTTVGDPLEVQALTRAFRMSTKRKNFCGIGSVKTNIGHLEQTAGMAALIKTALALSHATIPATINCNKPNPKLNLATSPFYIQTDTSTWTAPEGRLRRAGVNGLGLGGTNAFVVLEEAPTVATPKPSHLPQRPVFLALSAKSESAVRGRARELAAYLTKHTNVSLEDACFTMNTSRSWGTHRTSLVADSREQLVDRLTRVADMDEPVGSRAGDPSPVVFLFTGQGSQYFGMAQQLYKTQPAFRATIDECERIAAPFMKTRLTNVLYAGTDQELVNNTEFTQVALVAVEIALAKLWMSWGIEPDAVMGHSVGEIAAAHVAGALDLEGAILLAVHRGRLMASLPDTGGMAALFASEEQVTQLIQPHGERVSIAATNAPGNTVISGDLTAVEAVVKAAAEAGISARRLVVSHGFHSSQMDPILDELADLAGRVTFRPPVLKLISNLTGSQLVEARSADYWRRHARNSVKFMQGMELLLEQGYTTFLEIGPGTTLSSLSRQCAGERAVRCLPSLAPNRADWAVLFESLGELYKSGATPNWRNVVGSDVAKKVSLPGYPFERKEYWVGETYAARQVTSSVHHLVGNKLNSALSTEQFQVRYSLDHAPYLDDHRIFGLVVLPTTAALEATTSLGRHLLDADDVVLDSFFYREAMVIPEDGNRLVQFTAERGDHGQLTIQVASCADRAGAPWIQHIDASLTRVSRKAPHLGQAWSVAIAKETCDKALPVERYYPAIRAMGLEYGSGFRGIIELWQGQGESLSLVNLPQHLNSDDYTLHPALLDACLHIYPTLAEALGDFTTPPEDLSRSFLPVRMHKFEYWGTPGARALWVHAQRRSHEPNVMVLDIRLYDEEETLVGHMLGLEVRRLSLEDMRPSLDREAPPPVAELYQREWETAAAQPAVRRSNDDVHDHWLIFADRTGVGDALAVQLRDLGETCVLMHEDALDGHDIKDRDRAFHLISRDFFGVPGAAFKHVVYLWGLNADEAESKEFDSRQAVEALSLAQSLAVVNSVTGAAPRLWLVTRGALPDAQPSSHAAAHSVLWGLGASMATEYADLWGGVIDLGPPQERQQEAAALLSEMWRSDGEDYVALRDGKRLVPRITRADVAPQRDRSHTLDTDVDCLAFVENAELGEAVANWLITKSGAKRVTVAVAASLQPTERHPRALQRSGASVQFVECDLADASGVVHLVEERLKSGRCAVLYQVPQSQTEPLELIKPSVFKRALDERIATLRQLTALAPRLDQLVVLAPLSSWTGGAGSVLDAACGAAAEALVNAAVAAGADAKSIQCGKRQTTPEQTQRLGVIALSSSDMVRQLDLALTAASPSYGIAAINWDRWVKQFKSGVPALYGRLGRTLAKKRRNLRQSEDPRLALKRIQSATEANRRNVIIEVVAAQVATVLGLIESEIDVSTPLVQFGLDSLVSVNLVNRLEPALGVSVPVAQLLQGATITALVDALFPTLLSQATKAA